MNAQIDDVMKLGPNDCPRCGYHTNYHKMKVDGKVYIKCIRKKPYKLADGVDVHIGMQVWHFHPWNDDYKIITGMVRFIRSWGGLSLWKYPEERVSEKYTLQDGRVIDLPGRPAHEGSFQAGFSCFSSLENAEKAVEKAKKQKAELEAWRKKHKIV